MIGSLSWVDIVGLTAGALIIGVGLFVLLAKPASWTHRLFFLLALMDGMSTILYALALVPGTRTMQLYFVGTYYYHLLAFVALLALFGILFPKPVEPALLRRVALAGIGTTAVVALAAYVVDHRLFWVPFDGAIPAVPRPIGTLVNIVWIFIVAALVLRLTLSLMRETSESHRRQGAYVLGGMALAYMPSPLVFLAQSLALYGISPLVEGRWDRVLVHWSFVATAVALVASATLLVTTRLRQEAKDERNFVLGCYAGVLLLGGVALANPGEVLGIALRVLPLLAYPVLLGFAIARYEVFDIDRKLRRAATVSLIAIALPTSFVLAENVLEDLLASTVFGGLPSSVISGILAALVTAAAFVPIAHVSRKAAAKLVPELTVDELQVRKREIYLHSLAGAMADGILKEGESRTLAMLRESLGISEAEHKMLLAEVQVAT